MKNIHVLPTDKPSRLYKFGNLFFFDKETEVAEKRNQHIYITSDEGIKEGDWFLNTLNDTIDKCEDIISQKNVNLSSWLKKIILTTDLDLIKEGVQAIDDEFLEWFVKNPSCENVRTILEKEYGNYEFHGMSGFRGYTMKYRIIIPKEEPKQTIESVSIGEETVHIITYEPVYEEPKQDAFNYSLDAFKVPKEYFGKKEPKLGNTINKDELGIPKGILTELIGVNKQETLEEAAEGYVNFQYPIAHPKRVAKKAFINGAKWYEENTNINALEFEIAALKSLIQDMDATIKSKYSEEEVLELLQDFANDLSDNVINIKFWFNKFKKK